jgi:hypothetical protein
MTLGNSITNGAGTRGIAGSRLLHDPPAVRPAEANARYFRRGALCRDNREMRPSASVRRRLFR